MCAPDRTRWLEYRDYCTAMNYFHPGNGQQTFDNFDLSCWMGSSLRNSFQQNKEAILGNISGELKSEVEKPEQESLPLTDMPHSKATTTNPKDLVGCLKVSISKLPAAAIVHAAHAFMDGAKKYGPYNWRSKKVIASIYVDAAYRHLMSWFEGEQCASDSGVHHLGHAIACLALLIDAEETGNLVDDRPQSGKVPEILARLAAQIKARSESK